MKKITILFLSIFIVFGMIFSVNAVENETEKKATVEVSLDGPTSIEFGTTSITLTLKLGAFTGIEENKVMGYETALSYNKDIVKSVKVEGLNGWTATYSKDTQKIIGETNSAQANSQITKITYQLNDNLTEESYLWIVFSKFSITDDNLLDQTYDLTKSITIKKAETSEKEKQKISEEKKQETLEEKKNEIAQGQKQEQESQISKVEKKMKDSDNTKTNLSALPKAGFEAFLVPLIIIIAIIGFAFIARSKSIKLK